MVHGARRDSRNFLSERVGGTRGDLLALSASLTAFMHQPMRVLGCITAG